MKDLSLGAVERRFLEIIWANEPLSSGALVQRCAAELEWKKSTTYTVLKKLCLRGFCQNENGTVTSLISAEELAAAQSTQFVAETFQGSLPAFFAAFTRRQALSAEELDELRRMIDDYRG